MVLPLQLTAPSTAGSIRTASTALAVSTGSLNTISRLVVMSAWRSSSATRWVRVTSTTVGARASTVLATNRTPARIRPPVPITARLRNSAVRIGTAANGRSAMPEARGKNLELVAVLRDRAPGQGDPILGEGIGYLLVGEGVLQVLRLDHSLDLVLHAQ